MEQYALGLGAAERFDVVLAIYVAEHVREPVRFLVAVRHALKPGGALFVLTPNRCHYFGAAARTTALLGIDEAVLVLLRRARPRSRPVEHHPLAYRMNSVRSLRNYAGRAGFTRLEVRHLDNPAVFQYYFPGPAAVLPVWYSRLVYSLRLSSWYGTLLCRLTAGEAST